MEIYFFLIPGLAILACLYVIVSGLLQRKTDRLIPMLFLIGFILFGDFIALNKFLTARDRAIGQEEWEKAHPTTMQSSTQETTRPSN